VDALTILAGNLVVELRLW